MECRKCTSPHVCLVEFLTRMKGLTHKLLKGHTKWVFCLNYNPASNLLVSGGCEGDVRIWNVARGRLFHLYVQPCAYLGLLGKCMKTLHAHLDYVTAVHFNRDATLIVSCALDGLMCVFQVLSPQLCLTSSSAESGTQVTASA